MGPFSPSFGNQYILLTMDYVSKWVEAIACPRNDANIVVGFIQINILSIFGTPKTIISVKGSHFANKLFARMMSKYGIRHVMGLAYHPQSMCHAPNPGPTRLADPNRVRGARLRTGTLYLNFFFFF